MSYGKNSRDLITCSLRESIGKLLRIESAYPGTSQIQISCSQQDVGTYDCSISLCPILSVKTTYPGFITLTAHDKGQRSSEECVDRTDTLQGFFTGNSPDMDRLLVTSCRCQTGSFEDLLDFYGCHGMVVEFPA